jgi:hypothetical protein
VDGTTQRLGRLRCPPRCRSSPAPTPSTAPSISFRPIREPSPARPSCHQGRSPSRRQRRLLPRHLRVRQRWLRRLPARHRSTVRHRTGGRRPILPPLLRRCRHLLISGHRRRLSRPQARLLELPPPSLLLRRRLRSRRRRWLR